jgi:hypothetical protein
MYGMLVAATFAFLYEHDRYENSVELLNQSVSQTERCLNLNDDINVIAQSAVDIAVRQSDIIRLLQQ